MHKMSRGGVVGVVRFTHVSRGRQSSQPKFLLLSESSGNFE